MAGLWGEEFSIPTSNKKDILDKANKPKKVVAKRPTKNLDEQLRLIKETVEQNLGMYKDNTMLIQDRDALFEYFKIANQDGIIAVDTETNNSLDPLTCNIMGLCLYSPRQKAAYVPINHTQRGTDLKLEKQCTEQDIEDVFKIYPELFTVTHNGKFDYEVLKCTCNVDLRLDWDTMIGAKMLNENEQASLKWQYANKINPEAEKYNIETFFKGVMYKDVDPEVFALYAATDSYMTYLLYKYQYAEFTKIGNERLYDVFFNVEMPVVKVCADMELTGICLDLEYSERLQNKYHLLLADIDARIAEELKRLEPTINSWRHTSEATYKQVVNGKPKKSKSEQLANPPDVNSPTQLAIVLYDILKAPAVNKDKPRSTGKAELEKMDFELTKLILERKAFYKMVTSFIDTLPTQLNEKTGRLHAHFNQLGSEENNVVTGRFSCTNPNLQQIPAKNKEIRLMFKASPGYKLIGSDYSAQEPRLLTAYSKEAKLTEAFAANRDVYATLGAGVFNNDYWDNMEHHEDGTPNVDGKNRRKKMKMLLLGMMYGMGPATLAGNMNVSMKEANKIIADFYSGFPDVAKWIRETEESVKVNGYVEDFWGRRRRLPDVLLPEYSITSEATGFNPLLNTTGLHNNEDLISKYRKLLENLKYSRNYKADYQQIKNTAGAENVRIVNNGGFISRALRQSVNARIQGGAATMTKKAMIAIANDPEMKKYDFKLLIGVHDELIGECKEEYADECAERLVYLMKSCVPELNIALKCDPTIENNWAEDDYKNQLIKDFTEFTGTLEEFSKVHSECSLEQLKIYLEI